ncbi:MAG TPA: outer membrane beta-barrel protein [Bradyrhizobium sp.]|nr:outer membrane beta-barrel protein [Bradyrhizobium sp.]
MKTFLSALAALALSAATATAADLAAKTYTKAPVAAPVASWTGFYIGGNVGGEWGTSNATTSTVFSPVGYFATTSVPAIGTVGLQRINGSSVTGGFTAGYNWQAANFLFGLEGDINYFGFKGSATGGAVYPCCAPTAFTVNSSASADWLATIRGRLGILATPSWLLYVTGGAAIADVKGNFNFSDTFATAAESASIRDTRFGWTVGAGGEYALGNGWSIKGEYLYVDLGRSTVTSTNLTAFAPPIAFPANVFTHSVDLKSNIVRIGVNYKFGGPVVARY